MKLLAVGGRKQWTCCPDSALAKSLICQGCPNNKRAWSGVLEAMVTTFLQSSYSAYSRHPIAISRPHDCRHQNASNFEHVFMSALNRSWICDGGIMKCPKFAAHAITRKPRQIYPEKFFKPLFLLGGVVGQVYSLLMIVGVGVGPILQMHSCPPIIPLAPTSSRTEHDCVGPGVRVCDVG